MRDAFLRAGLEASSICFNFGDALVPGFVSSVDRALKRYPELQRFVTDAEPMPGIRGARRISNGPASAGAGESVPYETLQAIAAECPNPSHSTVVLRNAARNRNRDCYLSPPLLLWRIGQCTDSSAIQITDRILESIRSKRYGYILPDQNGWSRYLHFEAAWLLVFTGSLYVAFGLLKGHFRRKFPSLARRLVGAFDLGGSRQPFAIKARGYVRNTAVKCASTVNVLARCVRPLSVGDLDGSCHVASDRLCVPAGGDCVRWPAIPAHDSLLCLDVAAVFPAVSRHHGLSCRIPSSDASDNHRPRYHAYGKAMKRLSRRALIGTGIALTAGASGLTVGAKLAERYGLVPPDGSGIYGSGEILTYAAQRILTRTHWRVSSPASRFRKLRSRTEWSHWVIPSIDLEADRFAD